MSSRQRVIICLCSMLCTMGVLAQSGGACHSLVESALNATDESCFAVGRNQVCYGHVMADAGDVDGVSISDFATQGDVIDVDSIRQISTAPLNVDEDLWGIVLMRLQANVADTVPGQAVTFLIFGDAELEQTTTDESEVNGFVFKSGIGTTDCDDIPTGGLLFQSSEGRKELQLNLNGVDITAGSTLFAQISDDNTLQIALIEGHAEVIADGTSQQLEPQTQVDIPIDANGMANRQPSAVREFDSSPLNDIMQLLPGAPYLIDCAVGKNFEVAPKGLIYMQMGDGPHFPSEVDAFIFEAWLDGDDLPAISEVFLDSGQSLKQIFDLGVLEAGEYALEFSGTLTRNITDPLDQTWGPESWSWSCALTIEDVERD